MSNNKISKIFENLNKNSFVKQLAAGAGAGLVTGNFAQRLGKPIIFTAGAGVILLELAHHKGYINMNLESLKQKANEKKDDLNEKAQCSRLPSTDKIKDFANNNKTFTAGFIGGFLMGVAW
ncbi:unnamed protein product [Brassicogethes aeneus]|uniref:Uncharacterized protein n=1 Tax=Brassicogethes aeneus TaxID=1431903 RepID=A0A9P0FHR5_BRAAE|nr:unnamed protein product [Brassicogethes aeneus]